MALFKISKGLAKNLPIDMTDGYCWFTTDDGLFYVDYTEYSDQYPEGRLVRKPLNAADAQTLAGAILKDEINDNPLEIPTSGAVYWALMDMDDKKMDKENPFGWGHMSINRAEESDIGINSISLGTQSIASGESSFTSGILTQALGFASSAIGDQTIAEGDGAHAQGYLTMALGKYSHAQGQETIANGDYSFATGFATIASGMHSSVFGKFNIEDNEEKYAFIIGNGTDEENRSNAFAVDWNGAGFFKQRINVGGLENEFMAQNYALYVEGNAYFTGNVKGRGEPIEDDDLTNKGYVLYTIEEETKPLLRPAEVEDVPGETHVVIADKLSTDAGSVSRPIYIEDGLPKPCNDILNVSISGAAQSANSLSKMTTFKVNLNSSQESSEYNGAQAFVHDIGVTGILRVHNGGTGTHLAPIPGGIIYGKDETSYGCTNPGRFNQFLTTNEAGEPVWFNSDVGDAVNPVYFRGGVAVACDPIADTGNSTTPVYFENGKPVACDPIKSDVLPVTAATEDEIYYITGVKSAGPDQTFYGALPNETVEDNPSGIYFSGTQAVLFGAAWNDYAEFRFIKENGDYSGRVVAENGDDSLSLTQKRMEPVSYIISDTYGMVIGINDKNSAPVALSGRVLAYPYEDRTQFKVGDCVCSGPNGTVSIMTREEIINHPECIIGYVSTIPTYSVWGEKNTLVNNRIWIKIK